MELIGVLSGGGKYHLLFNNIHTYHISKKNSRAERR